MERYRFKERLKNGLEVTIRAAKSDDGEKIRRAFKGLDRETVYRRFFRYKADVTDQELRRITEANFKDDVALLATVGSGEEEVVIGGASYFIVDPGPGARSAEMAFTVEEAYQGLGLGTCLMRHLIGIARERGLTRLEADVLAGNLPMLSVFRRSGLPLTTRPEGDVVHLLLKLE
ncbi:MAG: GNAT family N-acetyltransferase [Acetobacteraceae bacterium]|nr:GNAT family N-acetyltransferase [Acetobacteraceae bacterium]MBV8525222.1 GNAT family N-acetyltransferase [Acetobacteraceae bacterium]